MIVLLGLIVMLWCSGCTHTQMVAHTPSEVVQIVQSLAPISGPAGCKTEEKVAEQEWVVIITEAISGEKFKHYEISFRILAHGINSSEITIEANLVNFLDRRKANGIARRYAERLSVELKKKEPQPPAGADGLPPAQL